MAARSTSKPTVTYFPMIGGRGFSTRAALRYAKYDFDDKRVPFEAFPKEYKSDPTKAPLGALPVLTLPEGNFVQSTALARWAARKSDLYPKDELEQLVVDEVLEAINEMMAIAPQHHDPSIKKTLREEYAEKVLPKYFGLISTRIQQSGGPFILGKNISIADLFVFGQLHLIAIERTVDFVPPNVFDQFPSLVKMYNEAGNHPIVQNEIASNKKGF